MSTMDPGKLKVAELKAELTSRGLDSKGVKAVLVQRLKEALEKDSVTVLDSSIVDTSTEEYNAAEENLNHEDDVSTDELPSEETDSVRTVEPQPKPSDSNPAGNKLKQTILVAKTSEPIESASESSEPDQVNKQDHPMEEDSNPDITKSTDESTKPVDESVEAESGKASDTSTKPANPIDGATEGKPAAEEQRKGEKRPRHSPSPQRAQRRRSKSPIKEDEPEMNSEQVFLSWYDSDLNLQIDKQSFLSAKPLHEGAFGYSWAGARTTHGVKVGKVCYEVKLTEELKWDDIIKQLDKRREGQRPDRRDRRRNDRKGRESGKKGSETVKPNQLPLANKDGSTEGKDTEKPTEGKDTEKPAEGKDTEKPAEDTETIAVPIEDTEVVAGEKIENSTENSVKDGVKKPIEDTKVEDMDGSKQTSEPVVASEAQKSVADKSSNNEVMENGKEEKSDEKPESMEVDVPAAAAAPAVPLTKHIIRCGWSVSETSLQLGETKYSYGFDSHGKFVNNNEFIDYGVSFALGDVIGAYANIDEEKVELFYSLNGVSQGLAISIPRSELPEENFALFPHILTRNFAFELNLGTQEQPWFPNPPELSDYIFIEALEDKSFGPMKPASRGDCEVIMMCGLPGSGKSHWVQEILKENPEKTYTIIGTTHLLQRMTINGKPLKESYKNRWNIILDRLMKCTNTLVDKAALRRRHFIIDQTNVFPSAQRRKMRLFEGFKRHAVVVVVSDEEQTKRRAQQEAQDGKDVPDSALLEMKANMSLPKCGDWLEEVKYVELGEDEAKAVVQKYNAEGKAAGFGGFNRRSGFRDNRGHPYKWSRNSSRRDYRDNYRDNRPYQNNRFRSPVGFQERRSAPSSWSRDFRDSRGPPRDARSSRSGGGRHDRSPRDRNPNYNRNPSRSQGSRYQTSSWQGGAGGAWQSSSSHSWGGPQGAPYQNWGQGSWSGQSQWKGAYGQGGYGQTGYGNWNYYGQYANNWQN